MKWASAISDLPDLPMALEECASNVVKELGTGSPASLATVFVSVAYGSAIEQVPSLLRPFVPKAVILGCSGGGVIGNGLEVEDRPAVAVTAGHLPDVQVIPFHITVDTLPTPDDPPDAWWRLVQVTPEDRPNFLLLVDPFSGPGDELLAGLDFALPKAVKVGGLASGGRRPGSHTLYLGVETYHDGAVGVAMVGDIVVETVVAQGCRPIGEPRRITSCHDTYLIETDGEPPLAYLSGLYQRLPPQDQALFQGNLFLGMAIDPLLTPDDIRPGDFLIRNLIGVDQEHGTLAVGEHLREGQIVQFHVRDSKTSAEDLERQLVRYLEGTGEASPAGALLFQCNGRGMHLYGKPNHDAGLIRETVGSLPLGGFFCNGEIGPVGGTTYLHGYTSSLAIFRKP